MNQKVFTQLRNEWRSNIWLALELLIVSVVMWYVVDTLYVTWRLYSRPKGFDIEHVYKVTIGAVDPSSPRYLDYGENANEEGSKEMERLLDLLRNYPGVEAASISMNAHPYQGSNSGSDFTVADTMKASGYVISRLVTPDYIKVFRYESADGRDADALVKDLREDRMLVSDNLLSTRKRDVDMKNYVGSRIYGGYDSLSTRTIGGVINTVLYNDAMQGQMNRTAVRLLKPLYYGWANEICLRVSPEADHGFAERFMNDAGRLSIGNIFVNGIESFSDIKRSNMLEDTQAIMTMVTGMAFLLLNIFLGLLGTFWFRTQQRVGDIAIRKVSGATSAQIFMLLISEGLLLLSIVTPLAILIDGNLAHFELSKYYDGAYFEWGRLLICGGIVYALMALMICLGIAIPARRAMKTAPALVLRSE